MSFQYSCPICTELFELNSDISAIPCGHTFHEHCIQRWLTESNTCPQCRVHCVQRSVIRKLFFNQAEESLQTEEDDVGKIKNDLVNATLALKQKESEKTELLTEKAALYKKIEEMRENYKSMEGLYQEERIANHSLRRELRHYQTMQKDAEAAIEEAKDVKQKLVSLQNVITIIKGCDVEIQQMISDHSNDSRSLATWCAVIQRELQTKREECRALRDAAEKSRKEHEVRRRALEERTDQLASATDHVRMVEEDLKNSEAQVASLKRKVQSLEAALTSPSDSRSMSLAKRLLNESPAPLLAKRPHLSDTPNQNTPPSSLDTSSDLFSTPTADVSKSRPTGAKLKCIDINTVGTFKSGSQIVSNKSSAPQLPAIAGMHHYNLFKRQNSGMPSGSMLIKTDYNGLGGYERHLQPMNRNGATQRPGKVKSKVTSRSQTDPPLPRLDNFIVLD